MENKIKKVLDIYLNYPKGLKDYPYYSNLGIYKTEFDRIVKDNLPIYPLDNLNDLQNIVDLYGTNLTTISRVSRTGKKCTGIVINIIFPTLHKLYVDKGKSVEYIMGNSPIKGIIDKKILTSYITRKGYKHSPEDKEKNRLRGISEFSQDKSRVDIRTKKTKETNLSRYGKEHVLSVPYIRDKGLKTSIEKYGDLYMKTPKGKKRVSDSLMKKYGGISLGSIRSFDKKRRESCISNFGVDNPMKCESVRRKVEGKAYSKENSIDFTPTEYVENFKKCKEITKDIASLKKFLKDTFPEKDSFTMLEISKITGRNYNTIKRLFRVDGNFIVKQFIGTLPETMQNYLEFLGYKAGKDFIVNDRQAIKPLEIDFYFPKEKVGIEVNDIASHNVTKGMYGSEPKPKNYHMVKSKLCKDNGIRLIHAWEHYFNNATQYEVLKNAIKHALGISGTRVYARNTYVKEVPNISLKEFFNKNNIQGFRGANRAYALFDKHTDEVLMAYSVGSSHFSHNKYDLELIRGASKLDTTVVGGASKLWKYIIDNNPEVNSIVYYIDRNIYNGSSINSLEGNIKLVSTQVGFWNYIVSTGEMQNRKPSKDKEIKELISQGKIWEVYNAGTETYVWYR